MINNMRFIILYWDNSGLCGSLKCANKHCVHPECGDWIFLLQALAVINIGATSEYPSTIFTCVGVLWRTRYITKVAILIQWDATKWTGILEFSLIFLLQLLLNLLNHLLLSTQVKFWRLDLLYVEVNSVLTWYQSPCIYSFWLPLELWIYYGHTIEDFNVSLKRWSKTIAHILDVILYIHTCKCPWEVQETYSGSIGLNMYLLQ